VNYYRISIAAVTPSLLMHMPTAVKEPAEPVDLRICLSTGFAEMSAIKGYELRYNTMAY
jgi:hypothetical protein